MRPQSLASRVEKLRRINSGSAAGAAGETVRELTEEVRACAHRRKHAKAVAWRMSMQEGGECERPSKLWHGG